MASGWTGARSEGIEAGSERRGPVGLDPRADRGGDVGKPIRGRSAGEIGIEHGEVIDHDPVVEGVDAGGEDLETLARQGPGHPMENARRHALPGAHRDRHRRGVGLPPGGDEDAVGGEPGELHQLLENLLGGQIAKRRRRQLPTDPHDRVIRLPFLQERLEPAPVMLGRQRRPLAVEDAEGPGVEIGEEIRFPFRPHPRPDRRDVGGGEEREHREHFRRPHLAGEANDERWIAGVAPEGEMGHDEMTMDEEGEDLPLFGGKTEAR